MKTEELEELDVLEELAVLEELLPDEPDEFPLTPDEPDALEELDELDGFPLTLDEPEVPEELELLPVSGLSPVPEEPADDELPEELDDAVTGVVIVVLTVSVFMESTSPKLFPGWVFEVICEFLATCLPRSISDTASYGELPLALPEVLTGVLLPS